MNRKNTPTIPEAILQLQRQLDQGRSTEPRRTKLPESLWQAAVELARQIRHIVYRAPTAARLRGRTGNGWAGSRGRIHCRNPETPSRRS